MYKKLVLFDIDGTIMDWPPEHKNAYAFAIKEVFGVDAELVARMGMTDQQIITETCLNAGIDEKSIELKMGEIMRVMCDYFKKEMKDGKVNVYDGAKEFLEELKQRGFLIGVVTGNLQEIAKIKLAKAGLGKYFEPGLGGFGSDHIIRTELVKLAIRRAEEEFGFEYGENVYSIGDAPSDMIAGREGGAFRCIGITTGHHSAEQLKEAGADFVFPNLKEREEILREMEVGEAGAETSNKS
jgi:phosphoglycolate phosphatase-like HAD superfamily hydrolase